MFSGKHFNVSLGFILEAQPYAGRSQSNLIKSLNAEVWEELLYANCYVVSLMEIQNDTNILKESLTVSYRNGTYFYHKIQQSLFEL